MLTIKRTCSNKIIARALNFEGKPLVALLMPGADDCEIPLDGDQLQASLDARPEAIIVYNQQADAIAQVAKLEVAQAQIFIEIRQDTKGVLGLQAFLKKDQTPEVLELLYQ